jgi:hypothetical protein
VEYYPRDLQLRQTAAIGSKQPVSQLLLGGDVVIIFNSSIAKFTAKFAKLSSELVYCKLAIIFKKN